MKKQLLRYPVHVEVDRETGTDALGYTAYCPSLGLAADGDSVEEALKSITSLIQFHLECLIDEGEIIPESNQALLTSVEIQDPRQYIQ